MLINNLVRSIFYYALIYPIVLFFNSSHLKFVSKILLRIFNALKTNNFMKIFQTTY